MCDLVAMQVPKSVVCGYCSKRRERRLHIMTAPMRLVHEGCGAGHFTVGGADYDLRKALAIASDGVHRGQSRALSVASRAGVSLKTRDMCGLGQLRLATDGTGPGERQERRDRELRGWRVRVAMQVPKSVVCGYCSRLRERRPTYYDFIHAPGA